MYKTDGTKLRFSIIKTAVFGRLIANVTFIMNARKCLNHREGVLSIDFCCGFCSMSLLKFSYRVLLCLATNLTLFRLTHVTNYIMLTIALFLRGIRQQKGGGAL